MDLMYNEGDRPVLCYINYTIESFKIAYNLVILPIAKSCRPMLQYSHDENNKMNRPKAGKEIT